MHLSGIRISILMFLLPMILWGQAQQESSSKKEKVQAIRIQKLIPENSRKKSDDMPESMKEEESRVSFKNAQMGQEMQSEIYWYNAYQTLRNSSLSNDGIIDNREQSEINSMIETSGKSIQGTFSWNYMQLRNNRNNENAQNYFINAVKLEPKNALLPAEAAWLAERNGNIDLRNKAIESIKNNGTISAFQSVYANWMLEVIPDGSLIVTNGEFDTYPIWEKQHSKKFYVVSLAMIQDAAWLKRTLHTWDKSIQLKGNSESDFIAALLKSNKPVFFSFTIRHELLTKYQSNLFPVGPLCRFSKIPANNYQELKQFYVNKSRNSYLNSLVWRNDKYAAIARNLIPGLIILEQSSLLNDTEKKDLLQLKKLIENSNSSER
jgi:hypothetical protein